MELPPTERPRPEDENKPRDYPWHVTPDEGEPFTVYAYTINVIGYQCVFVRADGYIAGMYRNPKACVPNYETEGRA